jgi:glycosyltransferase involved in cell wall biosynthesis
MKKERQPLVSIAIITYNQKEFLRECVESCLEQDYHNTEIVVADDGSTDGTQDMLNKYKEKYPGKFVLRLSEENQGITKNSNLAHFACSGKYIAWMGGDDLMLPGKILAQVEFMEKNDSCSICYHDLIVFDSKSQKKLYLFSERNPPRNGDISTLIKYGCFNGACSTMIRSTAAPEGGFDERLYVASDWLYWIESLAGGGQIKSINKIFGKYRRHDKNVTNKNCKLSQGSIDHLNTCNIILAKYPDFASQVFYAYAANIRSGRFQMPYVQALYFSLKVTKDLKALAALVLYFLSFKRLKL